MVKQLATTPREKAKILGKDAGEIQEVENLDENENTENAESTETQDGEVAKKGPKISVQRYKGLGEMNPEELWETTMDPAKRVLKQVKIDDAEEASRTFDMLMGSEVAPRKSFIQTNAKMANIDL